MYIYSRSSASIPYMVLQKRQLNLCVYTQYGINRDAIISILKEKMEFLTVSDTVQCVQWYTQCMAPQQLCGTVHF